MPMLLALRLFPALTAGISILFAGILRIDLFLFGDRYHVVVDVDVRFDTAGVDPDCVVGDSTLLFLLCERGRRLTATGVADAHERIACHARVFDGAVLHVIVYHSVVESGEVANQTKRSKMEENSTW